MSAVTSYETGLGDVMGWFGSGHLIARPLVIGRGRVVRLLAAPAVLED